MADSKSDLKAENDRLRSMIEDLGHDPDKGTDPNHGIVGNLADLQRMGISAVTEGKTNVDDAVVIPATIDEESGDTIPAQTVSGYEPPMGDTF